MRTMTGTEPTAMVPFRASIVTSPLALLGEPNLPAAKKVTDEPFLGTVRVRVAAKVPVVPGRKTTTPPPAADVADIFRLTVGDVTPDGLVIRTLHGAGDQVRNPEFGFGLLLI